LLYAATVPAKEAEVTFPLKTTLGEVDFYLKDVLSGQAQFGYFYAK